MKAKTAYFCQECGTKSLKWMGKCPGCGSWNTMVEETLEGEGATASAGPPRWERRKPVPVTEIESSRESRLETGIGEIDRLLGGGLVAGSLILVGGEPGIGKSTILLQVGNALASAGHRVLYVSGEESVSQTGLRARRLGASASDLFLVSETNLDFILSYLEESAPSLVVVDSIQTMFKPEVASAPGSIAQVRECGARLMVTAKNSGIPVILVGHVTKSGAIAGPRVLEHMVDTVLYFEGDRHHAYRILRAVKNRFGSTDEIGIFQMGEKGLREVKNPSEIFLSQRGADIPGSVVVPCLEGERPILVEVQALVTYSTLAVPRRRATGVDLNRVLMLLAVLQGRAGLRLSEKDVFVNVAGGVKIGEPAADLAVAAAVVSTVKNRVIDPETVILGEVGLGGEVRAVRQVERRLKEAAKLGFGKAVIPAASRKGLKVPRGMRATGVAGVREAMEALFHE